MFGKFSSAYLEVVVWKFEQRTFYISLLRVKVILACQEVHKISLALNELRYIASSFKVKHSLQACTTSQKKIIDIICKTTNGKL